MTENNKDYPNIDQLDQIYKLDSHKVRSKKGRKGFKIWLIVTACVIAFGALIGFGIKSILSDHKETVPMNPYVGVLYVEGIISSNNVDSWGRAAGYQHDFTVKAIDRMINDDNNKGIILYVDSPGGGVYESDELYLKIKEYKKRTDRPVFSYMASMAASGGYYISAPADMIFANRNCWTGSIGVTVGTFYDLSGFLENHGIKTVTIASGKNKAMGSLVDPMTSEQREIFQSLVDESYDQFLEIVADGRNMNIDDVRMLADGRIYTAQQALDIGLIDVVCTYKNALSYIGEEYDLAEAVLHEIIYHDDSFLGRLLNYVPLPNNPKGEAETILSLIYNRVDFPISYLSEILSK